MIKYCGKIYLKLSVIQYLFYIYFLNYIKFISNAKNTRVITVFGTFDRTVVKY